MSQQPPRRPARSRSARPSAPVEASATGQPATPIGSPTPPPTAAPEIVEAADEHGWIVIGVMVFGIAIVGFLAILIAMAA